MDNIDFSLANNAPAFDNGASTTITVEEDSSANDITSALAVTDSDSGDTLTWSVSSPPDNGGSTGGFPDSRTAGTSVTTSGLTYSPGPDISGTSVESFDVQVSDGTATDTITVTASITGVNDEPTLTASGDDPTFTEGGSAAGLYSGTAASTVESGQTFKGFTMTVSNVDDPTNEILQIDGSDVALSHGNTLTTATNGLTVSVTVVGSTATIAVTDGTLSAGALQTVLDGATYRHTGDDPTTDDRVVTLTSVQDSGGTANGGDDTAALSIQSTVSVVGVNDEPTLAATGTDPTYTEDGSPATVYSSSSADTIESGQTVSGFTLTVSDIAEPSEEQLLIDGSTVTLAHGNTLTTAMNSLSVSVSVVGTTATVTATGGTLSTTAVETLLDNVAYRHTGNTPTVGDREVTITSLRDSGGTANGGDNIASLSLTSYVSVTPANDEPTLTATGDDPTFTEGGSQVSLYSSSSADTIESGQTFEGFTVTVTNVDEPSSEVLTVDGSDVTLSNGNTLTTATNSLDVSVATAGSTATVSVTSGVLSPAALESVLDGLTYRHTGDSPTDSGDRVVTITSLTDSGGTANGGDDTAPLAIGSTVSLVGVNDEPTLAATGTDPTYTEGGSPAGLYSSSSASAVEGGQTFEGVTMTVSNVAEPSQEQLVVDGSAVTLTNGNTLTTATNSLSVSVAVIGSTATVTVSSGTLSAAQLQTVLDEITYRHTGDTPSTGVDRVVTITSLTDSGGTANGGDDTAALSITSIVSLTATNDEPTLAATGTDPTYTEGGSATSLYSSSSADTVESGQQLTDFTVTVTNLAEPGQEQLTIDGSAVTLTNGNTLTTATNSLSVAVAVIGSTATVSVSEPSGVTSATLETVLDGLTYRHTGDDPSTGSDRVVTITSLGDDGGTANGGDDTASLSIPSTVSLTPVNDEPTLTATGTDPTYTEGGTPVGLYSSSSASTVEGGQTFEGFTMTVTNVAEPGQEQLTVDGSAVTLTNGNTLTTADNSLSISVAAIGSTATVTVSSGTLSAAQLQTVFDGTTYRHTGDTPSTGIDRVVTITSLQDSGGTTNGGDDTAALSVPSTVSLTAANDAPTAVTLTSTSVVQSSGTDAAVGTLGATDPDGGSHTFSLVGGAGDGDNGEFSVDGTTLRADDAASLAEGEYDVRLQADDGNGGTVQTAVTISVVDDVAPTLSSSVPVDDGTGHPLADDITLTFSEPVAFGSGTITLKNVDSGTTAESFDIGTDVGSGDGTVSISGSALRIDPTADLQSVTEYAVRIDSTAVEDTANSPTQFAGIATDDTLDFTTADTTAPTVTSITRAAPTTAATNAGSVSWSVGFSEGVTNVSPDDFDTNGPAAATISSVSSSSGATITVTADGVGGDGTLGLDLASGDITDSTGNALDTTEPGLNETFLVDTTAPAVSGVTISDQTDANGVVRAGETVQVTATVTDATGVASVTATTGGFDAGSVVLADDGPTSASGDDQYSATFSVGQSPTAGAQSLTVGSVDTLGNGGGQAVASPALTVDAQTPSADAGSDRVVEEDVAVAFDGSDSVDDQSIANYEWDWTADGNYDTSGETPSHTFDEPGTYTVRLRVTDGSGNSDTDTVQVTVEDTTDPVADVSVNRSVQVGESVVLDGSGSTDNVGISQYAWDIDGDGIYEKGGSTTTNAWSNAGTKQVTLRVTDAAGHTDTETRAVSVEATSTPPPTPGSPAFSVVSVELPSTVTGGETQQLVVTVRNQGDKNGTYEASVTVNGNTLAVEPIAVGAGETETRIVPVTFEGTGTRIVSVGPVSQTITVESPAQPSVVSVYRSDDGKVTSEEAMEAIEIYDSGRELQNYGRLSAADVMAVIAAANEDTS